jgi:uncharacterized protein YceK
MFFRVLPLAAVALLAGCSTTATLTPAEGSRVEYTAGHPVMLSEAAGSVVQLTPTAVQVEAGSRMGLWINVHNVSAEPIDFDVSSVRATVRVYTYEELKKEIERQAMWAAIGQGLQAAGEGMQAANAGYRTSYTQGTASAYGSGGYAYGNYHSTTTTYDPAAAAAAQAQVDANNRARMAELAAARGSALGAIEHVVRRTTLSPGESYTGAVVIDAPGGGQTDFEVEVPRPSRRA